MGDYFSPQDTAIPPRQSSVDYVAQNQREDKPLWDQISTMGDAAYRGAASGLMLSTPERFYRSVRTMGDMMGFDEWGEWAGQKIEGIKAERENDPFYQPGEDIMDDPIARSIYQGVDGLVASTTHGLVGATAAVGVGAVTGGSGFFPTLAAFAVTAGGSAGLAEYDNFIDEAHTQFKKANPELTWQQVQDEVNSQALISAIAEGGIEFASDILAGKLMGTAGKAVIGTAGKGVAGMAENTAWQYHRKLASKLLKGALITGPLTEVPGEMATAAIQDKAREWAGMDSQGAMTAMREAFGPALVASILGGGGKSLMEHATEGGSREHARELFRKGQEEEKAVQTARADILRSSPVIASLMETDGGITRSEDIDAAVISNAMEILSTREGRAQVNEQEWSLTEGQEKPAIWDGLQKAKPRYGYRDGLYEPQFSSFIDKALYIVANPKSDSAKHNEYIEYLQTYFNGADEEKLRNMGLQVRERVKAQASERYGMGEAGGSLSIKPVFGEANHKTTAATDGVREEAKGFLDFLKGNKQFTPEANQVFQKMGDNLRARIEQARAAGIISDTGYAKATELYKGFLLPQSPKMKEEKNAEVVRNQLAVIAGEKLPMKKADEALNSSLLDSEGNGPQSLLEYANALGGKDGELERLRQRDQHTYSRIMARGEEAINNGFDAAELAKHAIIAENSDHVVAAAGVLSEMADQRALEAALRYRTTNAESDLAVLTLALQQQNDLYSAQQELGTAHGRALRMHGIMKQAKGQELFARARRLLDAGNQDSSAQMFSVLLGNMAENAIPTDKKLTTKISLLRDEVKELLQKADSGKPLDAEAWDKIRDLFQNSNWRELSMPIRTKGRYARMRDMILDTGISGMLMGPATHIANGAGNSLAVVANVMERAGAGMIADNGIGVNSREGRALLHGAVEGFWDALRTGWTAFKTNESVFGDIVEKAGEHVNKGFSSGNLHGLITGRRDDLTREQLQAMNGLGGMAKLAYRGMDYFGDWFVHLPGRTMLGCDEFFKTLTYHMNRRGLAYRIASGEEQSGGDFTSVYNSIMDGRAAPQEVHEQLLQDAARLTFQDAPARGSFWEKAESLRRSRPESMFVIPFLRTGLNIAKWAGVRTPGVANLFREHRENMRSGDPAVRQLAESQMMVGTILWHTGLLMAAEGLLTGAGPSDREEKELMLATGWRPNSVKLGDTYYEISRLDPFATFLNTAATFIGMQDDMDEADLGEGAAALLGSAIKLIGSKYYFQGISGFVNAVTNPERDLKRFLETTGASFLNIPGSGLNRALTRSIDPVIREADGYMQALQKTMPGISAGLPSRRTILGEEVKHADDPFTRLISPVRYSKDNPDPVYAELLRLRRADILKIGKPSRYITVNKQRVKLTQEQFSHLQELSGVGLKRRGRTGKEAITEIINSPQYRRLSDDKRGRIVEETLRMYRRIAKKEMIKRDPDLTSLALPQSVTDPAFRPLIQ